MDRSDISASKLTVILLLITVTTFNLRGQCFELVWSDEFNYTGSPDSTYWTAEEGGGGFGNNELQYYTFNDLDNAYVNDGLLTIKAIKEVYGSNNYTSARIITSGKFSVKYGKIEARMKLPYGQGIWPAFWMLGQSYDLLGWPECGEIDIMELVGGGDGRDNKVLGTAHWDNSGSHAEYGGSYTLSSGIFADDFHTFSIIWSETSIRWFVDDIQFHIIDITGAGLSEFQEEFFLILNVAVGGNLPGSPDPSTVFPQTLEVDYVRVYKNSESIEQIPMNGPSEFSKKSANKQFALPYSPDWTYSWSVPADASIVSGQDSSVAVINWGCTDGTVSCAVTGTCNSYSFTKNITTNTEIYGPQFISENELNVLFHIDSLYGSSIQWNVPGDATIVSGQGTDSLWVNWGTTYEKVSVDITNSCGTDNYSYMTLRSGQYSYPDINTPHSIPGTINSTEFDFGGEGISYHDLSPGNNGTGPRQDTDVDTEYGDGVSPNVGWVDTGEWLEFTVNVEADSFYNVEARVATANGSAGPFSLLFNGNPLLTSPVIANTGGWSNYNSFNAGTLYLSTTDTLMRLNFNSGGFNISKLTFTATTEPDNVEMRMFSEAIEMFPNPSDSHVFIRSQEPITALSIININGEITGLIIPEKTSEFSFDISQFSEGLYVVSMKTISGKSIYKRLLKTNY